MIRSAGRRSAPGTPPRRPTRTRIGPAACAVAPAAGKTMREAGRSLRGSPSRRAPRRCGADRRPVVRFAQGRRARQSSARDRHRPRLRFRVPPGRSPSGRLPRRPRCPPSRWPCLPSPARGPSSSTALKSSGAVRRGSSAAPRPEVLPPSTVTQAAASSSPPGAVGNRPCTAHAIAPMRIKILRVLPS